MLTDVLVPHNRWDLLAGRPVPRPRVSVVVVHYDQPRQLALTLAALRRQTLPPLEIVVADDGSREPVRPGDGPVPVSVVRQEDLGFRAAAARNAGAARTRGEVLVFLDADTVPEPGFVEALTAPVALCPDVLAVGRRRHADLVALAPGDDPAAAPELAAPRWLADGYARSGDLLHADGRSFRFVISAVLACRRSLFDDLGGFDERFVGYGGEDWDLAYRAWNAGAVLVHRRDAVAWHDGPDWAERDVARGQKEAEAARLAELIPEPGTRGGHPAGELPDVLVELGVDTAGVRASLDVATHRDLAIRPLHRPWSADQLRRARARVVVHDVLPPSAIADAMRLLEGRDAGEITIVDAGTGAHLADLTSTRAEGRARRWAGSSGLPRDEVVQRAFGRTTCHVRSATGRGAP
ncbi:glycosyltransferase [Pseudonocardia sp.]|uniref:glycosyltransferase n=1 Tax=Pseudonocardia sp. TaxID=60912 RepID=UPI003D0A43BD